MNREPGHPSRGSLDKPYWFYRAQRDFPDAMYFNGILSAFVASVELDAPVDKGDLTGSLSQWSRCQRRSGSFDEWYPFEGSYVATGFSLACVVLTLILAENDPAWRHWASDEKTRVYSTVKRAVAALAKRSDVYCENQRAIAAAAVRAAAVLYGRQDWEGIAVGMQAELLAHQTPEGWFPEYGGFDVGYSSVLLDYLAISDWLHRDDEIRRAAEKLMRLLVNHVRPDGATGGPLYSRGTEYLLPFGLLYFARLGSASASTILERHTAGSRRVSLAAMDDRYFVEYGYSWALAVALDQGRIHVDPGQAWIDVTSEVISEPYVRVFDHGRWRTWLSPSHGAGFVSQHEEGFRVRDYGALVLLSNRVLTLQTPAVLLAEDRDGLESQLTAVSYRGAAIPLRWGMVPFRVINYLIGMLRLPPAWLARAAKSAFVLGRGGRTDMHVTRQVSWGDDAVAVVYRFPREAAAATIAIGGTHRRRHVPSAHFWANDRLPEGAGLYRIPKDGVASYTLSAAGVATDLEPVC